jgi:hypothetical protein
LDPSLANVQTEVFDASCAFSSCHGGSQPTADLSLKPGESWAALVEVEAEEVTGATRVVPGDASASLLYRILLAPEGNADRMPPGSEIEADRIDLVKRWIEEGAPAE